MRELVRKLPFPVEFAIVLGGVFGYALLMSVLATLHPAKGPMHTEPGMWRTVIIETLQFLVIGGLLRLRGWTGQRLGLDSHWTDGAWGAGLAVTAYFVFYSAFVLISELAPTLHRSAAAVPHLPHALTPWIVAATVLLTSFFEEFFVTGYVVAALKDKLGMNWAVNASVVLRLAYHIYQGMIGVVLIIPVGLMFAYWYAKTGRLWPVIVAHTLLNLLAFLPYIKF